MSCNDVAISIIMDEMFCSDPIITLLTLKDIINITRANKHLRDYAGKYIDNFISKAAYITYLSPKIPLNEIILCHGPRSAEMSIYDKSYFSHSNNIICKDEIWKKRSQKQLFLWIEQCGFDWVYMDNRYITKCKDSCAVMFAISRDGMFHLITQDGNERWRACNHVIGISLNGINLRTLCDSLYKFKLRSITNLIKHICCKNEL